MGDLTCLSGNITATTRTIATATQVQIAAALSAAWIPGAAGAVGSAYFGTPNSDPGIVRVASSGNVNAIQSSGASKGPCIFSVTYPAA